MISICTYGTSAFVLSVGIIVRTQESEAYNKLRSTIFLAGQGAMADSSVAALVELHSAAFISNFCTSEPIHTRTWSSTDIYLSSVAAYSWAVYDYCERSTTLVVQVPPRLWLTSVLSHNVG